MRIEGQKDGVRVIAEVGSVHDGSFGNALRLIDVAAACGADVVKFQTHIASAETLRDAPMPEYFKGEPRYEYFERTSFTFEQWQILKRHCEEVGIELLSSPFSIEAVDLLEELDIAQYKVPSGEVTNLPLLERIAKTGKPVLLSSGMSSWSEIDRAVEALRLGGGPVTVLQCSSKYPCPYEDVGLNILQELRARYGLPVGLSDHTLTAYTAHAAVALGAVVIEKHLTFSREMYGSDARHSLTPEEFSQLVDGIRAIETALTSPVDKNAVDAYRTMKETFEKSVVSVVDIEAGALLTEEMLAVKKPGTGIPARSLPEVVGRVAKHRIKRDSLIRWDDLSSEES